MLPHREEIVHGKFRKEKGGGSPRLDIAVSLCYSPSCSLGGRAVRKKRQPDKAQAEMPVPYPAFLLTGGNDNGPFVWKYQNALLQILVGGVRQRADLQHLRHRRYGDGRAV